MPDKTKEWVINTKIAKINLRILKLFLNDLFAGVYIYLKNSLNENIIKEEIIKNEVENKKLENNENKNEYNLNRENEIIELKNKLSLN